MSLKLLELRPEKISESIKQKLEQIGPFIVQNSMKKPKFIELLSQGDYYGEHTKSKPNGVGTLLRKDGSLLEGKFCKSQPIGKCRLIDKTGSVFIGDWVGIDTLKSVKIDYPDGSHYEGDVENYKPHGRGSYKTEEGVIKGNFIRGKIHEGEIAFHDGRKYSGGLKYYKPNGKGKLRYPNKDVYKGEFMNGLKHGPGKLVKHSGIVYEGVWEDDTFAKDILDVSSQTKLKIKGMDFGLDSARNHDQKGNMSNRSSRSCQNKKNSQTDNSYRGSSRVHKSAQHLNVTNSKHIDSSDSDKNSSNSDLQSERFLSVKKEHKSRNRKQKQIEISTERKEKNKKYTIKSDSNSGGSDQDIPQNLLTVFRKYSKSNMSQLNISTMDPMKRDKISHSQDEQKLQSYIHACSDSSDEDPKHASYNNSRRESKLEVEDKNYTNEKPLVYRIPEKRTSQYKSGKEERPETKKSYSYLNSSEESVKQMKKESIKKHSKQNSSHFNIDLTNHYIGEHQNSSDNSPLEISKNISHIHKKQYQSDDSSLDGKLLPDQISSNKIKIPKKLSIYTQQDRETLNEKLESLKQSRVILDDAQNISAQNNDTIPKSSIEYTRQITTKRKEIEQKRENKGLNRNFSIDTTVLKKRSVKNLIKITEKLPNFHMKKQDSSYWCDLHEVDEGIWYKGEVDNDGNRSGNGVEVTEDHIFEGSWVRNSKNGLGREVTFESVYVGHWQNNQKSGFGKLEFQYGSFYSGDWKHDLPNGKGYEYSNSQVYIGDFVNGQRAGKSILMLKDGSKYFGNFTSGLLHGFVRTELPNSDTFFGIFSFGELASNLYLNVLSEEKEFRSSHTYRSDHKSSNSDDQSILLPAFHIAQSNWSCSRQDDSPDSPIRKVPFNFRPK